MEQLIFLVFLAGFLFLAFVFSVIIGIKRKSKPKIIISILFLFFAVIVSAWTVYTFGSKSYTAIKNNFKSRNGLEIYTALFGKDSSNCVIVLNKMDQIIPRLDCCIWLEFTTCQQELNRIISQHIYKETRYRSLDTAQYIPTYSPMPDWWKPYILADSVIVMQDFNFDNPNRDKILIFSKDSSHAFYCDMAD